MEIADKELIADFVIESQEGLANIENQMLAIEAAGANIDTDLVNAVFRTMHSIKGTAGFLGLDRIGLLAHGLEEILNNLRNEEIIPTSELVSTMLKAADYMKGLIEAVEDSNSYDVSQYVDELQKYRPGQEVQTTKVVAPVAIVESAPSVQVETESVAIEVEVSAGSTAEMTDAVREFLIECYDNLDQMERDLVVLEVNPTAVDLIRNIFRTIHTIKGGAGFLGYSTIEKLAHVAENLLSDLRNGKFPFTHDLATVLLATVDKCREGLKLVERDGSEAKFNPQPVLGQLKQLESGALPVPVATPVTTKPQATPAKAVVTPVAKPAIAITESSDAPAVNPETSKNNDKANAVGDTTIRVDVALLDKLMTRVGELVLARNQILQHTNNLDDVAFVRTAQRLNLITTELQESVMKTRMQPIGNVWTKFPRVVRDLASQLGKQVRIEMEGKETELDKTIVEAIKDPLTHVIRNSVDHGIEAPDVRTAAGKQAEGTLILRAFHEGGQVNIEITDDGAGLNVDRIRKKAVERGILTPEQASRITDREAAQIILLPGFSTAEKVTSVSGRGVGMDVVKTNIERIGGTIDLQTRPGNGTTVLIKIPLTLAIIPALIVTNDGNRYAIPQVNLLELLRLDGDQAKGGIEYVHGAPVYRLRGKLLPLINLSERLGLKQKTARTTVCTADAVNIVVLRANDRQFGLVVDKVNDTEEIVVKPLSRQLKGLGEYAGATIMGDGNVALILDVMGLAVAAGLAGEIRDQGIGSSTACDLATDTNKQTLLLVDLGDARRFALPTSMVSRLEKTPESAIEFADGVEVIQYRGTILPLVRLTNVFGQLAETEHSDLLQVIVYADAQHTCGFVVNRIVDIVETELKFSSQSDIEQNLLGTAVIQQRVTDVVNLQNMARHCLPQSR